MAEETIRTLMGIGIAASLILIWIVAYVDLARRNDLSILKKIAWALIMFFGAYIGIAIYFVLRPVSEVMGKGLHHTTPESSETVNDIEALRDDHANGSLSDADYLERKRSLLGLA
jgi:hypothetical protein